MSGDDMTSFSLVIVIHCPVVSHLSCFNTFYILKLVQIYFPQDFFKWGYWNFPVLGGNCSYFPLSPSFLLFPPLHGSWFLQCFSPCFYILQILTFTALCQLELTQNWCITDLHRQKGHGSFQTIINFSRKPCSLWDYLCKYLNRKCGMKRSAYSLRRVGFLFSSITYFLS